jgi:peptide-methionine (S)-S-oxide reductase
MFRKLTLAAAMLGAGVLAVTQLPAMAAGAVVKTPAPALTAPATAHRETAIFAGGCFWGVQGVYSHVKGVISATSGYTGGTAGTAHYQTVSTGRTGHAESVRVVFDPTIVSYADLLRIYFSVVADPTEVNRQGPDSGPQYRSALFPQNAAQAKVARAYIKQLQAAHVFSRPIVTRIEAAKPFYPAEGHHQNFYARHPTYPYIVINDRPKVEGLKTLFPNTYRG